MSTTYSSTCNPHRSRTDACNGHWLVCETCASLVCFKHAVKREGEDMRCTDCSKPAARPTYSDLRVFMCVRCKAFRGTRHPLGIPNCAFCRQPMEVVQHDGRVGEHHRIGFAIMDLPLEGVRQTARSLIRQNPGMLYDEAMSIAEYLHKVGKRPAPAKTCRDCGKRAHITIAPNSPGAYDICDQCLARRNGCKPKPTTAEDLFVQSIETAVRIAERISERELERASQSWRALSALMAKAGAGEMQSDVSTPRRDENNVGKTYVYVTCKCGMAIQLEINGPSVTCARCFTVHSQSRFTAGATHAPCS